MRIPVAFVFILNPIEAIAWQVLIAPCYQICDECKNIPSKLKMNMFTNDCHFFRIVEHSYLSKSSPLIVEGEKTFKFMIKFSLNAKAVDFVVVVCNRFIDFTSSEINETKLL